MPFGPQETRPNSGLDGARIQPKPGPPECPNRSVQRLPFRPSKHGSFRVKSGRPKRSQIGITALARSRGHFLLTASFSGRPNASGQLFQDRPSCHQNPSLFRRQIVKVSQALSASVFPAGFKVIVAYFPAAQSTRNQVPRSTPLGSSSRPPLLPSKPFALQPQIGKVSPAFSRAYSG
jgi:hypothetical protein